MIRVFLLVALLASCDVYRMSEAPAGQLAYPGAMLTNAQTGYGDSEGVTRTYSLATGATAGQVIDWYTQMLAPYGYVPSQGFAHPVLQGPRGIFAQYHGAGLFPLSLELHVAHSAHAEHPGKQVINASTKALARPVTSITVSMG